MSGKIQFQRTMSGFRVPKRVAMMTPAQIMKKVHGIDVGAWSCPNCNRTLQEEDYPSATCRGCGQATLPRVCNTKGCVNLCQPMTAINDRGAVSYYDPPTFCETCTKQGSRKQRAQWCERVTPADIYSGAIDYEIRKNGRESLDNTIGWWFSEDRFGKVSGQSFVYVYGEHGAGKSVGVMAHAIRGHIKGIISGLWYVSNADVERMARGTYSDDREEKASSGRSFYKCSTTDLLVIDDAGNKQGITRSVRSAYERIIGDRFRRMAPTIVISTRKPFRYRDGFSVFDWLDESMSSQFAMAGIVVEVLQG